MTVGELLRQATCFLEENRIPSPRLTAEVLLSHCLGRDRAFLYAHPEHRVEAEANDAFISMVGRRTHREPLQYITGVQEFYGRPFSVDPTVLIPRPETELIVESVLEFNRWPAPRILDVGTGSGCIATTLALEIPTSTVYASDISPDALRMAARNALRNHASLRLATVDLMDAWSGEYEFIVSNPPYISATEKEGLQAEVRRYEPAVALFGELEPVSLYERLIAAARGMLIPGGYLILEIGYTMEETVRALFGSGWSDIGTRSDIQGFPRVITARRTETDS